MHLTHSTRVSFGLISYEVFGSLLMLVLTGQNTDDLPVIGVSHIAIDPVNNQKMYIVTGDAYGSDTYSVGVLKSIDGGEPGTQLG